MPRMVFVFFVLAALALFAGDASALTIHGGSVEQRALLTQTIAEMDGVPTALTESRMGRYEIHITPETESVFGVDYPNAVGIASSGGLVWIDSGTSGAYFVGVARHELSHMAYFTAPYLWQAWANYFPGSDASVYNLRPSEHFAEVGRRYMWHDANYQIFTLLPLPSQAVFYRFVDLIHPFVDLRGWDDDLIVQVDRAKRAGLVKGYLDMTFRPSAGLLLRHAYLIATRGGMDAPEAWAENYRPALRGQVRSIWPERFLEGDRDGETLTRSQMVRVVMRGLDGGVGSFQTQGVGTVVVD